MNAEILNRKGARKVQDVPAEVLALLNHGQIESVNLTEWLAIDHPRLIQNTFPKLGISSSTMVSIERELASTKKLTAMKSVSIVGKVLYESHPVPTDRSRIVWELSNHLSDSIRCYAPYVIALDREMSIEARLKLAEGLVADPHFGVREVVWMAFRPEIEQHLELAISFLSVWAESEDENVRRFSTEATRPRGVWCKHIEVLKKNPALALPILEKLKADPSKYVQDSLSNWLNDASKSDPEFVIALCNGWEKDSPNKATARIIKKSMRTLQKKG